MKNRTVRSDESEAAGNLMTIDSTTTAMDVLDKADEILRMYTAMEVVVLHDDRGRVVGWTIENEE